MKRYYLAYGSNLNVRQMAYRCPMAKAVGTAVIDGYELLFKGSKTGAYLTIEPKCGASVPVAVWEVTAGDERSLNRYEGYPVFYYKKKMAVNVTEFKSGKTQECVAFVYIMHEDRPIGVPTKYYVDTCIKGYEDFGFDIEILQKAIQKSQREAEV